MSYDNNVTTGNAMAPPPIGIHRSCQVHEWALQQAFVDKCFVKVLFMPL